MITVVLIVMLASATAGAFGYARFLASGYGTGAQLDTATRARIDALEAAHRLSMTAWQTERRMYEAALHGNKIKR